MEVLNFIYNQQEIEFKTIGSDNVMVNATQMAKVFGKDVRDFTILQSTDRFILECLKTENSRFLSINSEDDLITSKQKSGTYMHRVLALKFAAWLDTAFELWMYITIDQILLGHYKDMKEATIEKILAEKELASKKNELIRTNPELAEIFELELKITSADRKRIKALKASINQLKLDLN